MKTFTSRLRNAAFCGNEAVKRSFSEHNEIKENRN